MKIMKKFILLILILLFFPFTFATTYYIDPVNGLNTNTGLSKEKAFKSLSYAFEKLKSGDILYLLNGTYQLDSAIRLSYKTFSPNIIITSYPGHKPQIKSNILKYENPTSSTWTKSESNIWYSSLDAESSEVIAQYKDTRISLLTYSSYTEFKDPQKSEGIYYDASSKKLYIKFSDSTKDPNKIRLFVSDKHAFDFYNVAGLTIANISILGSTRCINIDASSNINIEGITCFGGFLGISVKTSKNIRIEKNTIYMKRGPSFTYQDMKNKPYETTGIYLQDDYEGVIVKNNKVYGHFNGILTYSTSKGKFYNADVSYNTVYDIYDDAIEIENYCNGARYHHNDIRDSFVGFSLSPADASEKKCFVTDNLILAEKSILWDNSGTTYWGECFKIIDPVPTQNFNYSRNTCVGRAIYSLDYEKSTQKNSVWENNIFYSKDKKLIVKSGLSNNGIYYNYNLYFREDGGTIFQYWNSDTNSKEFTTLYDALSSSSWDGKWDKNSKNVDPKFNDVSKKDFRPKSDSPACSMSSTGSYVGAFPCLQQSSCGDGACNNGETCSSCSKDCGTCSIIESHWFEAEHAQQISLKIGEDSTASNNKFIYADLNSGEATLTFSIENPGKYIIWGRVIANNESQNSFYIKMDSENEILWDLSVNSSWNWQKVYGRNNTNLLFDLSKGRHTLTIRKREINSKLDKILITNDLSYVPSKLGQKGETPEYYCGDGICNNGETCSSCSNDCGACPINEYCGDGICNNGETCSTCSKDCGSCPVVKPYCGDNICNNNEDCNSCSKDCGQCVVVESNPSKSSSRSSSGSSSSRSSSSSSYIPIITKNSTNYLNSSNEVNNEGQSQLEKELETQETDNLQLKVTENNEIQNEIQKQENIAETNKTETKITGNLVKINHNIEPPNLTPLFVMLVLSLGIYGFAKSDVLKTNSKAILSKISKSSRNIYPILINNIKNNINNNIKILINLTKAFTITLKTSFVNTYNNIKERNINMNLNFDNLKKYNAIKKFKDIRKTINIPSVTVPNLFPNMQKISNYLSLNVALPIKDKLTNLIGKVNSLSSKFISNNSNGQDTRMIKLWLDYIKEYEKQGYTINQIKRIFTKEFGYDETLIDYIINSYVGNKSVVTNEIKREWHKYFNDCEKIGFTLKEIKEFLLMEKGYDKSFVETLINDYKQAKYIQE